MSTLEQRGWTPGPWRTVNGELIGGDGSRVEFAGSFGFALGSVTNRPDRVANSQIAITAPELFEALLAVHQCAEGTGPYEIADLNRKVVAALAKAQEGEQS